jgi:hypothetical protein
MRKGGYGALLAFTVAMVMFNGGGTSSNGAATASAKNAVSKSAGKSGYADTGKAPLLLKLQQGVCKLEPKDPTSCGKECAGFCPADDLRDTIKASLIPSSPPDKHLPDDDMKNHWNVPPEYRADLRFVVAAVPDPAHTHLSLVTDRTLEAIMEGAQASGYLFARSSLPWETQTFPESDDFLTRLNAADWQSDKETLPGLLIFRKATPDCRNQAAPCAGKLQNESYSTQALFVFIVGERPTSGLNKQQFQNALQIMVQIQGKAKKTEDSPLLILGPNFSGSLYSLDHLLGNDLVSTARPVIVHSGGISSYETVRWFMNFRRTNVTFRTFVESDDYQLARFLAYAVCERHYRPEDIAILQEDETAYGNEKAYATSLDEDEKADVTTQSTSGKNETGDGIRQGAESSHPNDEGQAVPAWRAAPTGINSPAKNDTAACNVDFSGVPSIYYPRDISHLRSAYQQQTQTAAASDAGKSPPRTNLALNIEDTGNDDDSIPTYSPGQTPLSEESVLLGIVSSLDRQHAKFVILVATNALDEIFLSQYLLRSYPEGRIVTFDKDLLLSREVADPRFQGILSVSPYPLFPLLADNGDNVALPANPAAGPSHHEFPWDGSVGTFNAMVGLLAVSQPSCSAADFSQKECAPDPPPDKRADLPPAQYAEYGWPALGKNEGQPMLAPPLWLTVIGNDGFWPLAILDDNQYSKYGGSPPSLLHAVQGDSIPAVLNSANYEPWELLCLLVIVIALIYTYLRWTGSIFARTKFAANFAPVDDSYCNYGLLIADSILFTIIFLLLSPWLYWPFDFGNLPLEFALWIVFALLVASAFADQIRRGSNERAGMSVVLAMGLGILSKALLDSVHEPSRKIFFYRFVHITSGVSPLVPFLILALTVIWGAWYTLAGLVLCDERGPHLPAASEFEQAPPNSDGPSLALTRVLQLTSDSNRSLFKVIYPGNLDPRVILLPLIALGLCTLVLDFCHPVRSLEGQTYDWAYVGCFVVVLFVLICDLFRLVAVWIEFRVPLGILNRLPLHRGFSRLDGLNGKSLWQLGGSAFDDFFPILGREIDTLGKLTKFIVAEDCGLSKAIQAVDEARVKLMKAAIPPKQSAESKENIQTPVTEVSHQHGRTLLRLKALVDWIRQSRDSRVLPSLIVLHKELAHACAEALLFLVPRWDAETVGSDKRPEPPEPTTGCRLEKTMLSQSTELAEEFVCLFYYNFICAIFLRLRSILMSVAGMFVLLVLSFSSYPFAPKTSYHTVMTFVLILIVALVAVVTSQMHRDPTLSRITNTAPGEMGWNFWVRLASFVALPLLTLLASWFPEIGGALSFWAQPALNTFK